MAYLNGVNSNLIQASISVFSARPNRVTAMIAEKIKNIPNACCVEGCSESKRIPHKMVRIG